MALSAGLLVRSRASPPLRSQSANESREDAMSAKQTGLVWELALPHNEAWVLMAMADHADHEGNNVYPGVPLLAWKTGYTTRQIRRILEKSGAGGQLEFATRLHRY